MGLLDDAIREHLELKRRHGADASEVAKKEREAFGPARSPAPPSEGAPADADVAAVPPGHVAEPQAPAETDFHTPGPAAPPPEPDAIPEPPVAEDLTSRPGGGAVSIDRFEPEPDVEWSELPPEPRRGQPEPEPEDEPASDDVLEKTPEFLEEAPEHDRLWFEQKPPRDFDF